MAYDVGEIVQLPSDITINTFGADNTIPVAGEDGTITERSPVSINSDGDTVYQYLLQYEEDYELVDASGIVQSTSNSFWVSEAQITGESSSSFVSESSTTASISQGQSKGAAATATSQSVLNQMNTDDLYYTTAEELDAIISDHTTIMDGLSFDPDNTSTADQSRISSDFLGNDVETLADYMINSLLVQNQIVTDFQEELQTTNDQNFDTQTQEAEIIDDYTDQFLQEIAGLENVNDLYFDGSPYTDVDWDEMEDEPPTPEDVIP